MLLNTKIRLTEMIRLEYFCNADGVYIQTSIKDKHSFPVIHNDEKYQLIKEPSKLFYLKIDSTYPAYTRFEFSKNMRYIYVSPVIESSPNSFTAVSFNDYKKNPSKKEYKLAVLNADDRLKFAQWNREKRNWKHNCYDYESLRKLWCKSDTEYLPSFT
jgi:hypothetical protein